MTENQAKAKFSAEFLKKYDVDELFENIVYSLTDGTSPYTLIEQFIEATYVAYEELERLRRR